MLGCCARGACPSFVPHSWGAGGCLCVYRLTLSAGSSSADAVSRNPHENLLQNLCTTPPLRWSNAQRMEKQTVGVSIHTKRRQHRSEEGRRTARGLRQSAEHPKRSDDVIVGSEERAGNTPASGPFLACGKKRGRAEATDQDRRFWRDAWRES